MGHRAQKNILRHGYKVTISGHGEKKSYKTERPAFTPEKGNPGKNKGKGYKNVPVPTHQKPKREKWAPRHLKKAA